VTVLITGSTKGLGSHLAEFLVRDGYRVITHGRSWTNNSPRDQISCDLLNASQVDAQFFKLKSLGKNVEHLICNAGKSTYKEDLLTSFSNISVAFEDNVLVATNAIFYALKHHFDTLRTITIIGSICGEEVISGAPLGYSVAKSALKALTKCTAHRLSGTPIRCNLVTPGNLMFKGSVWERKVEENPEKVSNYLTDNVPGGNLGSPKDIFEVIKLIISNDAKFVNGSNIIVDGGQVKRW
tara:strand:+ start:832 stop:1548 length:717 start_codon:yes stop_codon:yes gene_type:complete